MNKDGAIQRQKYEKLQDEYELYSGKYEAAMKEKMLMKLEKDRLIAKVDNLEVTLAQNLEEQKGGQDENLSQVSPSKADASKAEPFALKITGTPSHMPTQARYNPAVSEQYEPTGSHLSLQKTIKGHLMGVTSLSYNPKKDIVATGSDDTTWKLWSIPNGDLIMSGEGHVDWVGGVEFHPKGNLLATASGDGSVKIWDFVHACCAQTFAEHGQPVWKVAYHDTGDFLLSASMDHTVKLWDMNMKKSRFTFRGHVDSVNSVQFLPYS